MYVYYVYSPVVKSHLRHNLYLSIGVVSVRDSDCKCSNIIVNLCCISKIEFFLSFMSASCMCNLNENR